MLLYLDTRDLIALADNKSDVEREQFSAALARVGGELVYSLTNIMETCAPLRHVSPTANVMQRLNRLEQMPHRYLAEALIEPQELQEACDAFLSARSYIGRAPPLVPRFDYVISPFRPPATGSIVNYGLAQMVFDIWTANPATMAGYANQGNRLRALMAADRARADYRQRRPNFQNSVARHLHQHRIAFPVDRIAEITAWLQETAECCPAVKLGYEVYHALLKNVGDVPDDSDMHDLVHVSCVPYVDFATLDARMRNYVARADKSLGTRLADKLCRDLADAEARVLLAPAAATGGP